MAVFFGGGADSLSEATSSLTLSLLLSISIGEMTFALADDEAPDKAEGPLGDCAAAGKVLGRPVLLRKSIANSIELRIHTDAGTLSYLATQLPSCTPCGFASNMLMKLETFDEIGAPGNHNFENKFVEAVFKFLTQTIIY